MHYIILDTNIYREMGPAFRKHIDYQYFDKFVDRSPHEVVILDTVYKEFSDYFTKDYLTPLIKEYEKLYLKFEKNDFVDRMPLIDLTLIEKEAKNKFVSSLKESCWRILASSYVDVGVLTEFLLYNKRSSSKDNTRDFLILLNLIEFSEQNKKDRIIFITKDKIFQKNDFFLRVLKKSGVDNLIFIESISSYLSEYSAKITFLNADIVLKSIPLERINMELNKDITCFPSYISNYYHNETIKTPNPESIEILGVKLKEYYTYSEDKIKTSIVTSLIVRVKIVYEKEIRVNLNEFPKEIFGDGNMNRVDDKNRPIYENDILFIFEGNVDLNKKKILRQKFIDFIPDWNVPEKSSV